MSNQVDPVSATGSGENLANSPSSPNNSNGIPEGYVSTNMGTLMQTQPDLWKEIQKSIAMNMMNDSKHSNERVIQRMKEARYDAQKGS
jgi:hypothetical protein